MKKYTFGGLKWRTLNTGGLKDRSDCTWDYFKGHYLFWRHDLCFTHCYFRLTEAHLPKVWPSTHNPEITNQATIFDIAVTSWVTQRCSWKICPPWHSIIEIPPPYCPPPSCPPSLSPSAAPSPNVTDRQTDRQTHRHTDRHFCFIYIYIISFCQVLNWGQPHGLLRQSEPFHYLYPTSILICTCLVRGKLCMFT